MGIETIVTAGAVVVAIIIYGAWLGFNLIKKAITGATRQATEEVSADVAAVQTQLDAAEKTIENLNQAYDKAEKEIDQIKKWYEASINDRKSLERDKEILGRQLSEMSSKFHERDKDASVLEEQLKNIYIRVEKLEEESTHWREKAGAAQSEKDRAAGGQEFVKNFLFELIERVEAKELVRRVVEDVILNGSHENGKKVDYTPTSDKPKSESKGEKKHE